MKTSLITLLSAMLLLVSSVRAQIVPPVTPDPTIEKTVEDELLHMSLEEKIGQMIQVEINMVAFEDPDYTTQALMVAGKEKLAEIIGKFNLEKQFPVDLMLDEQGNPVREPFMASTCCPIK